MKALWWMCRNETTVTIVTNMRRASATRVVRVTVADEAEVVRRRKVLAQPHRCREAIQEAAPAARLIRSGRWMMWKGSDIGSDEMFGVLGLEESVLSSTGRVSGSRVLANFFSSYLIVLSYWLVLQPCDIWSFIERPTCNPIAAVSSDSVNLTSCYIGRKAGPMTQAALPFAYLDVMYVIEPRQTPLHTMRRCMCMCMCIKLYSSNLLHPYTFQRQGK